MFSVKFFSKNSNKMKKDAHPGPETPASEFFFFGSSLARDRLLLPFLAGFGSPLPHPSPHLPLALAHRENGLGVGSPGPHSSSCASGCLQRPSQSRKAAPVDCNAVGLSTLISLRCVGRKPLSAAALLAAGHCADIELPEDAGGRAARGLAAPVNQSKCEPQCRTPAKSAASM